MNAYADRVKPIINEIEILSRRPAYRIVLKEQENTDIFESKLGGVPYWDMKKSYPCDSKGKKLSLLCQINFDRAALSDARLPQTGMLQFFILDDDFDYGLDFKNPDTQDTFRVVYHEHIDQSVTGDAVLALGAPTMPSEYSPVLKECALSFEEYGDTIGMTSFDFDSVFQQAVKNVTGEETNESIYDYFTDDEYKEIGRSLMADGHKMLGYPFFTQGDPRECNGEYEDYYDTLLLQLDSVYCKDRQLMIWGDSGIANFFINSRALKELDFSRVLYNWDCY